MSFHHDLTDYLIDAAQRHILFLDVLRERGENYLAHQAMTVPNVLGFDCELVLDGRTLSRPVNYGIVHIQPAEGTTVEPQARPFIVIDPRAGHGPGIGGMKPDSEIGAALAAGHPCYFVGFTPTPMPGQTIEDVAAAEAAFVAEVARRHPLAPKPCVIGNCQAGWAVMGLAAVEPDLMGPLLVAGSPLSYWAGRDDLNPMRYSAGPLGGTWAASFAADLGAGLFDGAHLVQNFESLNPANTFWTKLYNVWSKVDTERERFLAFETWWGGHVLLTREEIEFITENLFVGNRLTAGRLRQASGAPVDLREVASPVVVFCSWGDNITPPQQALGWITDLYGSDAELMLRERTIVYCIHPDVGHLGIFVSGAVAQKEHSEFSSQIDLIDVLPPGLWEIVLTPRTPQDAHADLLTGRFVARFEARGLDDIRALGLNSVEEDRRFAALAAISEWNAALYKSWARPLVQALVTPALATLGRRLHPDRLQFEAFTNANPAMAPVRHAAERVRKNRMPAAPDNPFHAWQGLVSANIVASLDLYRRVRDDAVAAGFKAVFGQPWLQAMLGIDRDDPRGLAAQRWTEAEMAARRETLAAEARALTPRTAALRAMIYILAGQQRVDERVFAVLRNLHRDRLEFHDATLAGFKDNVRRQSLMLRLDREAAMADVARVLASEPPAVGIEELKAIVTAPGPLEGEALARFEAVVAMYPRGPVLTVVAGAA
ncbi:DUF3141 domain-containing protein [Ancylobacter lacus]|uniref:DUF3141 domain-containing protein n=1 Tax=Ancylobacter lacus TaxID=2579970 RepID=UPI001BCC08BB|nr:DUF3141 domain-containing protein [Ancylobacter lacus]MBS7539845.1 DUF3141 domain-containing protein [Ancylobacter lacus]